LKKITLAILISNIVFFSPADGRIPLYRQSSLDRGQKIDFNKRLIPAVTEWQTGTQPLSRFRFSPTAKDIARINKLRAGDVDTVRVLCLRVEFVEDTTPLTTGTGKMDTLGFLSPDSGLFYDPPHFKRYFEALMIGLRNYYLAQSKGRLYIDFTVKPDEEKSCYQLPREMQFYGDTISYEGIEFGLVRLMRDAFVIADRDPSIRFSDYDEFIIFHAGSGLQSDYAADGKWDSKYDLLAGEIPPGAIEAYLGVPYILADEGQTRIEQATVLPEMMRQDTLTATGETNLAGMIGIAGTLAHEFAHLLGAYDLYDVTGLTMGVGGWSLMGYGGWLGDYGSGAPPGVIPGFLDAYHRVQLGFINPIEIKIPKESVFVFCAAMDTTKFSRSDSSYPTIIKININQHEYFLIENRQTDVNKPDTIIVDTLYGVVRGVEANEYDFFLPGSGILIWHIDETVIADYGPYNAINIFPEHKGVDLEEADGIQDFDVPYPQISYEVLGYKYDAFSKQGYNDRFNAQTAPNSDGYTGKSFISITLLGKRDTLNRLKDTLIPINITWELYQPGFPVDQRRGSALRSAFAVDLDNDGNQEIITADSAGQVNIWRSDGTGFRFPSGAFVNIGSSIIADVAIGNVTPDSGKEVVVAGQDGRIRVYNTSAQLKLSLITRDRVLATPVLFDLNEDGYCEIIAGSLDGKLYVWNYNGETVSGFPIDIGSEIRAPVAIIPDAPKKIVLLTADHRLFVYDTYGRLISGYPITLGNSSFYATAQPLVADFNRDGEIEIAVVAGGEHHFRLYIIEENGTVHFTSREIVDHPFTGTLAAADINRDGFIDVICASRHKIYAFNYNGTLVSNYPLLYDSTYSIRELAGNWIITYDLPFEYRSSPVVADLTGDDIPDLVIGSPQYGLLGFDGKNGKTIQYFPLMTTSSLSAIPLIADIDGDGKLEIACGSDDGVFYVWKMPVSNFRVIWNCAYHDPEHTGYIPQNEQPAQIGEANYIIDNFFLYPNPADKEVNIRYRLGKDVSKVSIMVLDMSGQPIIKEFSGPVKAEMVNEYLLRLGTLAPGIYVVRLQVEKNEKKEIRFAKLAIIR